MAENPKKRNRRVFSCLNCRRKKRRCDRGVPCGECARNGFSDSCLYEDVKPYKPVYPQFDPQKETMEEKKVPVSNDWQFNLFEAVNTSKDGKTETNLLGYTTMAGADPLTAVVKRFLTNQNAFGRLWQNLISKDGMVPKEKLDKFERKAMAYFGVQHIRRLNSHSSEEEFDSVRQTITAANLQYGLAFKPYGSWTQLSLLEQILLMLPPYSVVLLLVREYFKFLQKWLPILDEKEFFSELNRVVGPALEGNCVIKSLELPTEAAILATLLLAIRLAYCTVVSTKDSPSSVDRVYILENPVVLDTAYVATELLKESATSVTIHSLRALMILQTFHIFSPERGLVTENLAAMDVMRRIQNLARELHLDIDHKQIGSWRSKVAFGELDHESARSLWHTILRLDVYCCVLFDRTSSIFPGSYLSKLPSEEVETEASQMFAKTEAEFVALLDLVGSTMPLSGSIGYTQLSEKLKRLEDAVEKNLGRPGDYLRPLGDEKLSLKCSRFQLLLICKSFLLTVYYSLYLFFECRGDLDLSIHYLKKRMSITQRDFCFLKAGMIKFIEEYFGSGSRFVLTPFLMSIIGNQVGAGGIRVRFAFTLRLLEADASDIQSIKTRHLCELILKNIRNAEESSLELAEALGETFQFAWAATRSTRFGQRMVDDDMLYEVSDEIKRNTGICFTVEQLTGLDLVLNEADVDHKLYTDMFGVTSLDKDKSSEARERRLFNALQLEKKWLLVMLIQAHALKTAFLKKAGVSTVEPSSTDPVKAWQYDLELMQGYDPQLLMEFFGNV